ncbi:uncharacterized protein [Muntiacus reevesi]|uniref:uncharacterized protein n=1 Tax=Muntiacus reevesi TaxID=9886 RepID=UPI003306B6CA
MCVAEERRAAWPRRPPLSRDLLTENTGGKSLRPESGHQPAAPPRTAQPSSRPEGAWPRAPPASTLAGACLPQVLRLVVSSAPAWLDCMASPLRGWIVRLPAQLLSKEDWRSWEFIPLTGGDGAGLPTPPAKHELRPAAAAAAAAADDHQRGVAATHPAGERAPLHLPRQEMCDCETADGLPQRRSQTISWRKYKSSLSASIRA